MRPIFVRKLTEEERQALRAGLRSSSAFTVRRCQILLASAEEHLRARAIAARLRCSDQCVREAIHGFHRDGLACLQEPSHVPQRTREAMAAAARERLREIIHTPPREWGQETSVWTLERLAQVAHAEGLTAERVSDETIRRALKKLHLSWRRAKHWIQSPDPQYERKKSAGTG
jgi:transposase